MYTFMYMFCLYMTPCKNYIRILIGRYYNIIIIIMILNNDY